MSGFLRLNRQSGDIKLPQRNQMLGLSRLQTDTRFTPGNISTKVDIVTNMPVLMDKSTLVKTMAMTSTMRH